MTTHIRQFTGKKAAPRQAESAEFSMACCAHNCPLVGTISPSTGGGSWRCWAHDRLEEASQWPYLTQGINENMWLFTAADHVLGMTPFDLERPGKAEDIGDRFAARGRPELRRLLARPEHVVWRTETEPRTAWVVRIRAAAFNAAWDYVKANWSRAA